MIQRLSIPYIYHEKQLEELNRLLNEGYHVVAAIDRPDHATHIFYLHKRDAGLK